MFFFVFWVSWAILCNFFLPKSTVCSHKVFSFDFYCDQSVLESIESVMFEYVFSFDVFIKATHIHTNDWVKRKLIFLFIFNIILPFAGESRYRKNSFLAIIASYFISFHFYLCKECSIHLSGLNSSEIFMRIQSEPVDFFLRILVSFKYMK